MSLSNLKPASGSVKANAAIFLPLATWPLTANGKIDRQALEQQDIELQRKAHIPLRSKTEKILGDKSTATCGNKVESEPVKKLDKITSAFSRK